MNWSNLVAGQVDSTARDSAAICSTTPQKNTNIQLSLGEVVFGFIFSKHYFLIWERKLYVGLKYI